MGKKQSAPKPLKPVHADSSGTSSTAPAPSATPADTSSSGWRHLSACPICGGTELDPVCEVPDRHYRIAGVYAFVQCAQCRLAFLNPLPDDSVLVSLYPKDYYAHQDFAPEPAEWRKALWKLLGMPSGTRDPQFPHPGRMLDIGCGSGETLLQWRARGWEVQGVEVNERAAALGRSKGKLDIRGCTLLDAQLPANTFDYVRSNHAFEHIWNPVETVAEMVRILKPGGTLFVGVPNFASVNAKLFKDYWWFLGAPVHTFQYSPNNLSQLLKQSGLENIRVQYNSDWSGVLGSIQILLNRNSNRISTEGKVFHNSALRVLAQRVAKLFDACEAGDAMELIATKPR